MNSLESRSHGHKYFEYEFCTYLWGVTFWLDGFRCIYGVWRSDLMVFSVFIGCDVLIECFLMQRKPSNQNVTPHKYSENHPIRTSHSINTAKTIQSERHTMGCDVLIGWCSLYLWGVTFWLDGFCCIYGVWRSDWMVFALFMGCDALIGCFLLYFWIRTSHPINTEKKHPIRTSQPINTAKTIQSERHTP
jgi:hypothetical protein